MEVKYMLAEPLREWRRNERNHALAASFAQ